MPEYGTVTLPNVLSIFSAGTLLKVYSEAVTDSGNPRPLGPSVAEDEVEVSGAVTFTGLEEGTQYYAAAKVEGEWRMILFHTLEPPANIGPEGPPGPPGPEGVARNAGIWLQNEGVVSGTGAADQREKFQAALDKAAAVAAFGNTSVVVSGEPGVYNIFSTSERGGYPLVAPLSGTVVAGLHVPKGVLLEGAGTVGTSSQFGSRLTFKGLPAGAYALAYPLPPINYSPWLRNWNIKTSEATPEGWAVEKTPPAAADALLHCGGFIEHIVTEGKFRYSVAALGNHAGTEDCSLGGWAAVGFPSGHQTGFDNFFLKCILTGQFCSIHVEPNNPLQGFFQRCHLGYGGGPHIYMNNSEANSIFIQNVELHNCSFEGGGRGLIVDDNMLASVTDLVISQPAVGDSNDGPLYAGGQPGDPAQIKDALIKAKVFEKCSVSGDAFLKTCGMDDALGCVIRAKNMFGCDWGDIAGGLAKAILLGKPFMRVENQWDNTAHVGSSPGREVSRARVGFVSLTGTVKSHDLLRRVGEGGPSKFKQYKAKQFDSAGKVPAGIAMMGGINGDSIPVVLPKPAEPSMYPVNVAHLGGAEMIGSGGNIPPTAKTGSTKLTTALKLGAWESVPRLLHYTALNSGTIALTTLGDLPTGGGIVSIGSVIVTYTAASVVGGVAQLTGCTGGSGSAQAGVALGRVATVEATTGFGTAPFGGLLINGTVYATYIGAKEVAGVKYIYGISASKGGGEIASTATVVDQTIMKVEGSPADYPEGPAAAYCLSNNAQWAYEAFREDLVNASSGGRKYGYFIGISRTSGTTPATQYYVVGGTTINAEVTLPAGTLTVKSTIGFPSSGKLRIGTQTVTYTGITGTTFTGCTEGAGTMTVGQPVTPISGGSIENEAPIRPRFSPVTSHENDRGLAAQSSGPLDANGYLIGSSSGADEGGKIVVEL